MFFLACAIKYLQLVMASNGALGQGNEQSNGINPNATHLRIEQNATILPKFGD
jgi:hypothetical protein